MAAKRPNAKKRSTVAKNSSLGQILVFFKKIHSKKANSDAKSAEIEKKKKKKKRQTAKRQKTVTKI